MKVFISWSGDRSRQVAELLDDWLQCVIQAIDPWMSSKDIDRGSLWFTEINEQLSNTAIGIICLTKENKEKPWILFESGALAKGLSSSKVCTLLIDLKSTDVGNPLAQFNHTLPKKDSIYQLVSTLNKGLENSLREKVLESVFETYWPKFEKNFNDILKNTTEAEIVERSGDDILLEILSSTRSMERRVRNLEGGKSSRSEKNAVIDRHEAEKILRDLIRDDIPEAMIMEIMKNKDVPLHFVERFLKDNK